MTNARKEKIPRAICEMRHNNDRNARSSKYPLIYSLRSPTPGPPPKRDATTKKLIEKNDKAACCWQSTQGFHGHAFQQSKSVTHIRNLNVVYIQLAYWRLCVCVWRFRIYWNIQKMDRWCNEFEAGYACASRV